MENQFGNQPSTKEIEEMMTKEQKEKSEEREAAFEAGKIRDKEDLNAREKIMQLKDRIIDIENPKISVNVDLIIKGVADKRFATIRKIDSKGIYVDDDREFIGFEKIEDIINRE